jgi:alkylation response protein AidB-like acyl-CoA dehydrogenase
MAELAFEIGKKYAARRFDDHAASAAQWSDLVECGFTALSLPEQYGGAGGIYELTLVSERLAAGGYPAAKLIIATAIAGSILSRHGSPDQKAYWLPRIASGECRFCFAFTEPGAGSNPRNLQTAATRVSGGWRVRGEKTFISALESSEAMLLVARDSETGRPTVFAFPLPHSHVSRERVRVDAPVFEHQWSVFFEEAEFGEETVVGEPGGGGKVLFDGLNPERVIVAAHGVGVGRWCIARGVEYAKQRVVFDVPIGAHQAVQHPLAEAWVALQAGWALTEAAARLLDDAADGSRVAVAASAAKLASCDAGFLAADRVLQVFGGSGYTEDVGVLQRYLYMRLLRSVPVARELVLNHLGTQALGLPRSY